VRQTVAAWLANPRVEAFIIGLILLNAVILGLETDPDVMAAIGPQLLALDKALLAIFVVEIAARLWVQGQRFWRDGWNIFDFTVVAIALIPASGPLAVLRALRVLRVLRLITMLPSLKRVVGAMVSAIPGMGSIVILLVLVFYVAAVMATKLFGADHPEQFGAIPTTLLTLFQLMTLDGWSGEIVKPVLEKHPYAWLFFIPFILISAFVVLNLFIGVVVSAMQAEAEANAQTRDVAEQDRDAEILTELRALRAEVAVLQGKPLN
jgi:voltage-gated sodium channel